MEGTEGGRSVKMIPQDKRDLASSAIQKLRHTATVPISDQELTATIAVLEEIAETILPWGREYELFRRDMRQMQGQFEDFQRFRQLEKDRLK